jgi:Ca2+-binding RTX toxin-like protein
LNMGGGSFLPHITFAAGNGPQSVVVGDFDNDDRDDLAIANRRESNISTLLNIAPPAITLPANGTYTAGQTLTFSVRFSEAVTVTGTPILPLTIGSSTVNATYQSATNNTLTFSYTVVNGNVDSDGITLGSAISGSITDAAGNAAVLTLPRIDTAGIRVNAPALTPPPPPIPTPAPTPIAAGMLGTATSPISLAGGKKGITQRGNQLTGSADNDVLRGTKGSDVLKSGQGNDKIFGLNGNDRLLGMKGNDVIDGGKGNDLLNGGKDRDLLLGGEGNDKLLGGMGDDILIGGKGADMLTGGGGKDMFAIASISDGVDTVTDFNAQEDLMDLRSLFAQSQFAGATPFARYSQFVKLVQMGANTEVQIDADGNGAGTSFVAIALLQNTAMTNVTSRNFVIV